MRVFALDTNKNFVEHLTVSLGRSPDNHEERDFEDGEHKMRPLVSVRDEDVYVVHSLYSDQKQSVNDKLCKLLFFIATLRDAGASRITAVVPYLCYARKDRRTKPRDPVTFRYVATLFEAVKVDRVVTMDIHNLQAYQNGFRCLTEHLEAQKLFVDYFMEILHPKEPVVVMSPDIGGVKRAEKFRDMLSNTLTGSVDFAFMEKQRSQDVVSGTAIAGEVKGKTVIILDDLISGGTTMARAAAACKKSGSGDIYAVATHGLFNANANAALAEKSIKKVIITNSVSEERLTNKIVKGKLVILDVGHIFARVIQRLNAGSSLVALMENYEEHRSYTEQRPSFSGG